MEGVVFRMEGFETGSELRLGFRRRIRAVVDAWVHGPVELLVGGDLRELRGKLREEWDGELRGYRYAVWCAEVNLVLGTEGDPLRFLRGKRPKVPVRLDRMSDAEREWFNRQGYRGKVLALSDGCGGDDVELGPLFGRGC
jgi:hypothetical protein